MNFYFAINEQKSGTPYCILTLYRRRVNNDLALMEAVILVKIF